MLKANNTLKMSNVFNGYFHVRDSISIPIGPAHQLVFPLRVELQTLILLIGIYDGQHLRSYREEERNHMRQA